MKLCNLVNSLDMIGNLFVLFSPAASPTRLSEKILESHLQVYYCAPAYGGMPMDQKENSTITGFAAHSSFCFKFIKNELNFPPYTGLKFEENIMSNTVLQNK